MTTVNEILEANKDKHESVLVIGFNKMGKIHIDTNRPTFEFVNYAINRANYNINHLETAQVLQSEYEIQPPSTEAEVAVEAPPRNDAERRLAEQVFENIEAEKPKRGRPRKNG